VLRRGQVDASQGGEGARTGSYSRRRQRSEAPPAPAQRETDLCYTTLGVTTCASALVGACLARMTEQPDETQRPEQGSAGGAERGVRIGLGEPNTFEPEEGPDADADANAGTDTSTS
jgi:hypothetical protein